MLRIAILDDYQRVALRMADWARLDGEVVAFDRHLGDPDEAAAALADFDVLCLMRERMPLPRALLDRLPRLKLVVFTGARNQVIDVAAAAERGVTVCRARAPGGGSHGAAEATFALILACVRHLPREERAMRAGGWQTTIGTVLHGKTLALLGLGNLGSRVARYGLAFDMRVIAWSQNLTAERASAAGATLVSRDELFRQADILSIHVVLSPRTRGLVGRAEIALMKPSATLINTARGPIVDEAALVAALTERRIRGAGLDVFDEEPLPADHVLRRLDNVVLTPHIGYVTQETYDAFYPAMLEAVAAWRRGEPVEVYQPPA